MERPSIRTPNKEEIEEADKEIAKIISADGVEE